jgi:Zn-dependent alcohol dehydrogenase
MKPPLPFVPGMEVAGRVVVVGPDVKTVKVGDRVAALSTHGSYAERVAAAEPLVMPLPPDMPAADACALLAGYGTSHYALKQRGVLREGETLCVLLPDIDPAHPLAVGFVYSSDDGTKAPALLDSLNEAVRHCLGGDDQPSGVIKVL